TGEYPDQRHRQCIADLDKRIELATGSEKAKLLVERAQRPRSLSEYDAALDDYAQALDLTPDDHTLRYQRAQLLLFLKRVNEALQDADALLKQAPSKLQYLSLKGWALSVLKRDQEAITV